MEKYYILLNLVSFMSERESVWCSQIWSTDWVKQNNIINISNDESMKYCFKIFAKKQICIQKIHKNNYTLCPKNQICPKKLIKKHVNVLLFISN